MEQTQEWVSGHDKERKYRPRWPDGQFMKECDERYLKLQSGEYDPEEPTLLDVVMRFRPALFRPKKLGGPNL